MLDRIKDAVASMPPAAAGAALPAQKPSSRRDFRRIEGAALLSLILFLLGIIVNDLTPDRQGIHDRIVIRGIHSGMSYDELRNAIEANAAGWSHARIAARENDCSHPSSVVLLPPARTLARSPVYYGTPADSRSERDLGCVSGQGVIIDPDAILAEFVFIDNEVRVQFYHCEFFDRCRQTPEHFLEAFVREHGAKLNPEDGGVRSGGTGQTFDHLATETGETITFSRPAKLLMISSVKKEQDDLAFTPDNPFVY